MTKTIHKLLAASTAAAFAAVSDFQTLGAAGESLTAVRNFDPGEAWISYQRQIGNIQALSDSGLVRPIKTLADFQSALAAASAKLASLGLT